MKRSIFACLAGLLTWMVVVTVINRLLRLSLPNYTAAEQMLQFTLGMKWARLLMAIVTSVMAGAVTGGISRSSRWAPLIVGSVVLAMFVPVQVISQDHEPIGIAEWQRTQEDAFDQRKNGRRCANAERQGEDNSQGEAGCFSDLANGKPETLCERAHVFSQKRVNSWGTAQPKIKKHPAVFQSFRVTDRSFAMSRHKTTKASSHASE